MESTGVIGDLEEVQKVVRREWPEATDELCEQIARTGVKACAMNFDTKHPQRDLPLWKSKVGGVPYLPVGAEWPKPKEKSKKDEYLGFLCQINFGEIDAEALPDPFPRSGILQWYVGGQDGMFRMKCSVINDDQNGFRVIYWPDVVEDEKQLWPRDIPPK